MDSMWTVCVAMTFGAYHFYVMDKRWKLQQEIYKLQDEKAKAMLELAKRKWW